MSFPTDSPGQTKWFCLILGVACGIVSLASLGMAAHALVNGRVAYNASRGGRVDVTREENPRAFHAALRSVVAPCAVFVPLSLIGFYFYRRLRD